jgi:predicted transposase/invertase (TIGR01784 family)
MKRYSDPDLIRRRQVHEMVLLQKYADIITDTVFKRLFGDANFPDLMLFLLRELIPERKISSIKYSPQEHQSEFPEGHNIRVDVECVEEGTGARFAVEMQAVKTENFHDRLFAYSTYIVQKQFGFGLLNRPSRKWDYTYPPSYIIALMDYDDNDGSGAIRHEYAMLDKDDGHLFTDRVKFITMELPKYRDPASQEATILDKFCYAMHNMKTFQKRPDYLEGKFFELLFEKAEIAKFAPAEVVKYEADMMTQWDIDVYVWERIDKGIKQGIEKGVQEGMEKGMQEGMEKGLAEGQAKIIRSLIASGMSVEEVAKRTGMSIEEVRKLADPAGSPDE